MAKKLTRFLPLSYLSFIFIWLIFCFYSFSQLDPNLTIYNYPVISNIIDSIKYWGYNSRLFSTILFSIIIILFIANYIYIIFHPKIIKKNYLTRTILILIITGIFAYPFLSHDIFNYLFNAKMILIYKTNPHIHTALEFPNDLWTRFMHNTHTAAPYGYLFTGLSLIPAALGFGNFTLTLLLMKLLSISFFVLQAILLAKILKLKNNKNTLKLITIFLLNPLFLIEIIINGHNDAIMITLAFSSFYFLLQKKKNIKNYILSLFAFISSIFIKYATIILAPIYFLCKKFNWDFFTFAGLGLLFILFSRIGQTHSWYLFWGLSFLFFSQFNLVKKSSILLSFGGLIRYIPFIYDNNNFPSQNYLLLFLPLLLLLIKKPKFN